VCLIFIYILIYTKLIKIINQRIPWLQYASLKVYFNKSNPNLCRCNIKKIELFDLDYFTEKAELFLLIKSFIIQIITTYSVQQIHINSAGRIRIIFRRLFLETDKISWAAFYLHKIKNNIISYF